MLKFDHPTLVTLTAPTCAGKNFLLDALAENFGFSRIVSTTDRAARMGEIEGVHYNFISTEKSLAMERDNLFAELVTYNGTRYGVTHVEMANKVQAGLPPPIVILEPQGLQIYKKYCMQQGWQLFSAFINTPEKIRLSRLVQRTTDDICTAVDSLESDILAASIAKIIAVNNARLTSVIENERMWLHASDWHAIVSGTDIKEALNTVQLGVANRKLKNGVYQ